MKLKKEVYLLGVIFVFVLGYFLGQSSVEDENKDILGNEKNLILQEDIQNDKIEKKLYSVLEVIDGDTIKINYENKKVSVRIIGINTPETDGPYRKTECFGKESSNKAKEILKNKKIEIELDSSQSKWDKHGRLLSYILVDGEDFGLKMIKNGYAYENTYRGREYKNQKKYKEAQKYAENLNLGLWSKNSCEGKR